MSPMKSSISINSEEFNNNAEIMAELVAELRNKVEKIKLGGGDKSRAKHIARGKLLPGADSATT